MAVLTLAPACRSHRETTYAEAQTYGWQEDTVARRAAWSGSCLSAASSLWHDSVWLQAHVYVFGTPDSTGCTPLRAAAAIDYRRGSDRRRQRADSSATAAAEISTASARVSTASAQISKASASSHPAGRGRWWLAGVALGVLAGGVWLTAGRRKKQLPS